MSGEKGAAPANSRPVLVRVEDLKVHFPIRRGLLSRQVGVIKAVDGISFDLHEGETLGLVGESGCGKSTTARAIVQLVRPTSGHVYFRGEDLGSLRGAELRRRRRNFQMIFQDPYSSLNRRMTVRRIVEEPLRVHGVGKSAAEREARVAELLQTVGLDPAFMSRYPYAFSGGQRQRIGIARALALHPDLIVCDEPISALDVSIQAQVVNLLKRLQAELGLTYLFIAHDLSMVRHISDRVAVMYLGKIVEMTDTESLYQETRHPYTRSLLAAIPVPDPAQERRRTHIPMEGDVPSPANVPSGCRFRTRCWLYEQLDRPEKCVEVEPPLRDMGGGRLAACHWSEEINQRASDLASAGQPAPLQGRKPVSDPEPATESGKAS